MYSFPLSEERVYAFPLGNDCILWRFSASYMLLEYMFVAFPCSSMWFNRQCVNHFCWKNGIIREYTVIFPVYSRNWREMKRCTGRGRKYSPLPIFVRDGNGSYTGVFPVPVRTTRNLISQRHGHDEDHQAHFHNGTGTGFPPCPVRFPRENIVPCKALVNT